MNVASAFQAGVDRAVTEGTRPLTLESLFRTHADDVCRIVARLLGPGASDADVDDLAQQVFLAAHRALPRFRGDSQVRTWMYGITARIVLQHLRGRRRYQTMIERFEAAMAVADAPPGLEEEVARRQALRRVWSALLRIRPERRVVFVLFEIEGLSAVEIGGALGLSEEAVRSRLRRAREDLAARMKEARR